MKSKLVFTIGLMIAGFSMVCAWWSRLPVWLIGFFGGVVLQIISIHMTEE